MARAPSCSASIPATMGDIVDVGVLEGSVESLDENDLAVFEEYAAEHDWTIGDTVPMRFAETGTQLFDVALIFSKDDLTGDFFIGTPAYEANFGDQFDFQVYVLRADGVTPDQARVAVESVASRLSERDGAGPAGVQAGAGGSDQPAARPRLRAARSGDRHRAHRDRQHARALDRRAHPRARAAAGGRHDPFAAPGDGPVGVGDDRAVRHPARA